MGFARYQLEIDWSGTGAFVPWTYTGESASSWGGTATYFIGLDATVAANFTANDLVVLTAADGVTLISETVHRVTSVSPPAFGFRNVLVTPNFPVVPVSGQFLKVVLSTGTDVSARQLKREGLVTSYGRDQARSVGRSKPGEASFSLDDTSGDYSPENGSSPLGDIFAARPVRIRATTASGVYTLYRGQTDDFRPSYGRTRRVDITCLDVLGQLSGVKISTALYAGIRTGEAFHAILDAVGFTGGRDIDPGATGMAYWWADDEDALDAVQKLVDSEGIPAYVGGDGNGNFVFRDRHSRLIRDRSTVIQSTWRASGAEPRFSLPVEYEHGYRDVINSISWECPVRLPAELTRVWEQKSSLAIQSGETVKVIARASDPFYDARVPVDTYIPDDAWDTTKADVDLRYGNVNVSLDRTSGQSVTISLTAVGGPAEVSSMALRARPVPVVYTVKTELEDGASIHRHTRRGTDITPVWAGVHDQAALAAILIGTRAERLPTIRVRFESGTKPILEEQLKRDLGDRVRVVYADAFLDREFYVESARHEITGAGEDRIHRTTFECEAVPEGPTGDDVFVLDESLLDGSDVLAGTGYVDPAAVLILDETPLGEGVLAY